MFESFGIRVMNNKLKLLSKPRKVADSAVILCNFIISVIHCHYICFNHSDGDLKKKKKHHHGNHFANAMVLEDASKCF